MNKLSLFSGIGADDLASSWAGINTVCMCEIDPWCQRLLAARFPGIPIIGDVRNVNAESIRQAPHIDLLSSGTPCQPASTAGKRKGSRDDRWLWPEAIRIIGELRPTWAVLENPLGIESLELTNESGGATPEAIEMDQKTLEAIPDKAQYALDAIIDELADKGYEAIPICIPACSVGAVHLRYRIFLVAHIKESGSQRADTKGRPCAAGQPVQSVCYPAGAGLPDWAGGNWAMPEPLTHIDKQRRKFATCARKAQVARESSKSAERPTISDVVRVVHGVARKLDIDAARYERTNRIKALGNAVVPQQVYPIYKAIVEADGD